MQEIWRDIDGYNGVYKVSNKGNIKSEDHMDCNQRNKIKGRMIKPATKENGYKQVRLTDEKGKSKNYYVHRLVMYAFVGECPKGCEVNHIDENKANNNVENLEYIPHKENTKYGTRNIRTAKKIGKAVVQYDTSGAYIKEYGSTMEAERETKIFHNNISAVCKRNVKTAGGYLWRYKLDGQEDCG